MILVIILSFLGNFLMALRGRKLRLAGFVLALIASSSWVVWGVHTGNFSVAYQFGGYTIIAAIGIWSNRKDAKTDSNSICTK
jgi:hypothetical protein